VWGGRRKKNVLQKGEELRLAIGMHTLCVQNQESADISRLSHGSGSGKRSHKQDEGDETNPWKKKEMASREGFNFQRFPYRGLLARDTG